MYQKTQASFGRHLGRMAAAALILLVLSPDTARADSPAPVAPGARIRLSTQPLRVQAQTGVVSRVSPDTLSILLEGEPTPRDLPVRSISSLERHDGVKREIVPGMVMGLIVGVAVGAAAASGAEPQGLGPSGKELRALLAGAGGGLFLGAIVGSAIKTDRWVPVRGIGDFPIGARLKIGHEPGIVLSARF